MKKKDIEILNSIKWWHQIELEPGIFTPNAFKTITKEKTTKMYGMPEDLSDKTVLDIGCWDGGFSFEAEKRGAEQALNELTPKEQAALKAQGTTSAPARQAQSAEDEEQLKYAARHGNDDALVALIKGVSYKQ